MTAPARRTLRRGALALAAGWLLAGPAAAQSLKELYEAARNYDPTYLAIAAQVRSAPHAVAQQTGRLLPQINFSASVEHSETKFDDVDRIGSDSTDIGFAGTQWLFDRGLGAQIDAARLLEPIARADLQLAEQDLIVRVAQAYFDVLAAQDNLTTAQANRKAISEQLASAKRNFEVGTATITDTREAQARFDLATAQELAAENDLRTRRIALDLLVGRENINPKPLRTPVVLPPVEPRAAEDWVKLVEQSPLVRKAQYGYEVAKFNTRAADFASWPTLQLEGSIGASNSRGGDGLFQSNGTTSRATIGVRLALPVFRGGILSNAAKERVALEEQARNDLEAARRQVGQETRQVFYGVQSGLAQVKAFEAAESSSKLALEATQLGYRVGVRVNLDVLNAQTQLFQTQRDLARARYDVILNNLRLRQAAGVLSAQDVDSANGLLAR